MKLYRKYISIMLFTLSLVYFIFTSEVHEAQTYFLVLGIVGCIKIFGFLIMPLSKYVEIHRVYIYLCLYLGGSGLLTLTLLTLMMVGNGQSFMQLSTIGVFLIVIEFIAFYSSIRGKDEDSKEIVTKVVLYIGIFTFVATIILALPSLSFITNFLYKTLRYIRLINAIIYIPIIVVIKKYSLNKIELTVKRDIIMYIYIKIAFNIISFISGQWTALFLLKVLLLLLGVVYVARIFFVCIVSRPNEALYSNLKEKNEELRNAIEELENYSRVIKDDNEHIKNLINAFPESIAIAENRKIIFTNSKFKELFECTDDELHGMTIADIIREDYGDQLIQRGELLEKKGYTEEIEYVFKYNNREFVGEVISSKIKRGSQNIVICVIRDVTKKKLIEALNKTIDNNKKENKIRSEVLTNLSHEFKTPVNVIYSAMQMQELYSKSNDIDNVMKFTSTIKQNCFRLLRLINNFIDITRFESNLQIKSNIRTLNIVTLVENITDSVISYCNDNDISIIFDTENEEVYGKFDSEMMDRVMLNLLSNAIKYNVKNGSILVCISETDESIIINIKDTGLGITLENLKNLFNRFERGANSSGKKEGTGIGLNIVKSLVEYQNGKIEVESQVGVGTTFKLVFPKINVSFDDIEFNEMEKEDLINKVTLELSDII